MSWERIGIKQTILARKKNPPINATKPISYLHQIKQQDRNLIHFHRFLVTLHFYIYIINLSFTFSGSSSLDKSKPIVKGPFQSEFLFTVCRRIFPKNFLSYVCCLHICIWSTIAAISWAEDQNGANTFYMAIWGPTSLPLWFFWWVPLILCKMVFWVVCIWFYSDLWVVFEGGVSGYWWFWWRVQLQCSKEFWIFHRVAIRYTPFYAEISHWSD